VFFLKNHREVSGKNKIEFRQTEFSQTEFSEVEREDPMKDFLFRSSTLVGPSLIDYKYV
jgi:hypothetical protein